MEGTFLPFLSTMLFFLHIPLHGRGGEMLCTGGRMRAMALVRQPFMESVLSFHVYVGSRDQTKVARLGW